MEMADVYDIHGNRTGKIVEKDSKVGPDEYLMGVGIWIKNQEGKIFATRRSLTKRFMPGKWENTGGHVMAGEEPEDAIVRELQEETGITISKDQITYLGEVVLWPSLGKNYGVTMEIDLNTVDFTDGECIDARWLTKEEFIRMRDREEFAPSVFMYMKGYLDGFQKFMGWEDF